MSQRPTEILTMKPRQRDESWEKGNGIFPVRPRRNDRVVAPRHERLDWERVTMGTRTSRRGLVPTC